MKTPIYKPGTIKFIQIITLLFGLQINFLFASNPVKGNPVNNDFICITCSYSVVEILLTPTTPVEATFSDEVASTEINLEPTTPSNAPFDNDPEVTTPSSIEYLAPTTPAEADFDDEI